MLNDLDMPLRLSVIFGALINEKSMLLLYNQKEVTLMFLYVGCKIEILFTLDKHSRY